MSNFFSSLSTMVKNLMHEGKLVPSELIVKLLLKAMLQSGNDKFLVDGFPRNAENRQAYESVVTLFFFSWCLTLNYLSAYIYFDSNKRRIAHQSYVWFHHGINSAIILSCLVVTRLGLSPSSFCSSTAQRKSWSGAFYTGIRFRSCDFSAQACNFCLICLIHCFVFFWVVYIQGRDDDNIDTIRKRFEVFQESTLPVVQYYEKRGKLRKVTCIGGVLWFFIWKRALCQNLQFCRVNMNFN